MITNELLMTGAKETRDHFRDKVDVLEKVKVLNFLHGSKFMITEQVATYYEVGLEAIQSIVNRHRLELEDDGYRLAKKAEVISELNIQDEHLTNVMGKSIVKSPTINMDIPNRGLRVFPKRAILRIGMLLRDSPVAQEIRTLLLNTYHDAERGKENTIENIQKEITTEQELSIKLSEALLTGEMDKILLVMGEINGFKNKRIKEVEGEMEDLVENKLSIKNTRKAIRAIVNTVASDTFYGKFHDAWNNFYRVVNYKLGINIKNRKGTGSLLNKLTESELDEALSICKSWAKDKNIDYKAVLKL